VTPTNHRNAKLRTAFVQSPGFQSSGRCTRDRMPMKYRPKTQGF